MPFQPEKIKRQHILQAIKEIEKGEIEVRPSTKFDIFYDGKTYPPKDTMRLAHEYATGEYEWYPGGGEPTNKYIEKLGFEIVKKDEHLTISVKKEFAAWLLRNGPRTYKDYYGNSVEEIETKLDEINSYFLDKDLFNVDKDNYKNIKKYLLENIYENRQANKEFDDYDKLKGNGRPKAILGRNNYFKFLDEKFGSEKKVNYWIFQGNPKIYDIIKALQEGHLKSWKVAAHKEKIKQGDKVILWQTGDEAGCYALAEVVSEVGMFAEEPGELQYYSSPLDKDGENNDDRVKIEISKDLVDNPIFWSVIKDRKEFTNFKAGNQGTNFTATEDEYKTLLKLTETARYTWVKTYKGIVHYLKDKESDQLGLINLLKDSGCDLFNDRDEDDNIIPLEVIDPFTFFCYINKYFKQRLEILQNLARIIDVPVPSDDSGIPSTNPQKVWLFPYKSKRTNNEIDRLWAFFYAVMENKITEELFADILLIKGVANTKLTEVLSYVDPENHFPINGPTKPYLEEVFDINPKFASYSEYNDILNRIRAKTDKPFYQISYEAWLWNNQPEKKIQTDNISNKMKTPLNQIFFGPPGTGKTYNTINEAIRIIDREYYDDNKDDRKKINEKYRDLLITDWNDTKGQVAFCTFHQSFSYEDFVEGIKPQTTQDKNVYYDVLPGIFKKICELADSSQSATKVKKEGKISWNNEQFRKAFFYKLSLGEANNPEDREIYEFCIKSNYIAIGFGVDHDYSGMSETQIKEKCKEIDGNTSAGSQLSTFIHGLSKDDYVLISKGNQFVRALGKVTGEYEYHDDFPIRYNHFRKVEWIFVDENIPIEDLYETTLTQRSIYKIDHDKLKMGFFVPQATLLDTVVKEKIKPYVLIIDEINRGNVSSIFGELITLIEHDKRAGEEETLQVVLPYSKDKFSVPNNVYIIGTMNTADRSVEALDSALRRRFSFREMPPKSNLILEKGKAKDGMIEGINLKTLLDNINTRIEKLIDKDHRIGHSYFLKVRDMRSLKNCFKNEIIPLLEEYFFGDYGKIGLVLGNSFVEKQIKKDSILSEFEGYESDIIADLEERAVYKIKPSKNWDFKAI